MCVLSNTPFTPHHHRHHLAAVELRKLQKLVYISVQCVIACSEWSSEWLGLSWHTATTDWDGRYKSTALL